MAKKTFYLGTSIKISDILSVSNPDSVKITIEDPSDAVKVNAASMTKETDIIYTYIYQSATTDTEGDYVITITVTKGAYTSLIKSVFTLEE